MLKSVLERYGSLSSWKLSSLSHEEFSWKKANNSLEAYIRDEGKAWAEDLYGELLPKEAISQPIEVTNKADMLIIGGTSLKVMPASSIVDEFQGEHLIIINKEPLDVKIDSDRDIFFESSLGDVTDI